MRKLFTILLLSVALLTGCSSKAYEMSGVTVVETSEVRATGCRGVCYDYFAKVTKDGNTYKFQIDSDSYTLVEKGTVVDLEVINTSLQGKVAHMTPVGVEGTK